jgi:hypothetical protein
LGWDWWVVRRHGFLTRWKEGGAEGSGECVVGVGEVAAIGELRGLSGCSDAGRRDAFAFKCRRIR